MIKAILPLLALGIAISAPVEAQECDLSGGRKIESERYVLAYRTKQEKIAVSQHFTVELAVCARSGQAAPEGVRVDGFMPEHNHGMNYKVVVKPAGSGRYEATGLMFHMPGRWDFIFEVRGGGKTDRMTHSVILR